ncbi:MAG: hypothetical protein JXB05_24145 [Myxococcaceae bacterium]|nr:hypothetical protein [Myxococcaceae bacterium]
MIKLPVLTPDTWAQLIWALACTLLGALLGYFFARLATRRDKAAEAREAAPQVLQSIQWLAKELQNTYEAQRVPWVIAELETTILAANMVLGHRRFSSWHEVGRLLREALRQAREARDGEGSQAPQLLAQLRYTGGLLSRTAEAL